MSLYNLASGELKKENKKLKQEIQRLKGALQTHEILLQSNTKEIERLNNIINKFDKWLDEESEKTILSTGHLTCLMMCKNKLQELKGSDNNE